MKEIVKKIKIYDFNELKEDIQEKLIEKEIECCENEYSEYFLYEDLEQKARELLRKYFKNNADIDKIYYDLSYCQGSGAMIQFKLKYYNKLLLIEQYGNYCHQYSFKIIGEEDLTSKQYEKIKEKIVNMNNELTKYGYDLIENCTTRQDAINNLSNLWFLESGEIYIN